MKSYKKLLIILIAIILLSIFLVFLYFKHQKSDDTTLGMFNITSVTRVDNDITVLFDKSKNATHYVVTITDENDNILYQVDGEKNRISIGECHAEYDQLLKIKVVAFNRNEEQLSSSNLYEYKWENPSFDDKQNKALVAKDTDFSIKIIGDVYDSSYYIKVFYQNNTIYEEDVENNYVLIPYERLKDYNGRLTALLYNKDDIVVHKMNFYNNPVLVSNVTIISPIINEDLYWDAVNVKFDGGENATIYKANVYYNNKLQKTIIGEKSLIEIPATTFKEYRSYKIEVIAMYGDYEEIAKKDEVTINIGAKKQVSPVYTNRSPDHVNLNEEIELFSKTNGAIIKYTMDGSNPLKKGIVYDGPITITKDVKIRAIAIKENLNNSDITTFDFKINDDQIVVYLSPSNQYDNLGVSKVGYTNERDMMNKVADKIQEKLESNGVKVLRNDPKKDMLVWLSESRSAHADLHFAIHSNGSSNHDTKGMEIYVNDSGSKMLSLATLIYNNLYDVYPYQSMETDRGIKYADGSLGEVNPLNTSVGILIEIAHHDDRDDAKWMVDNLDQISNNISSTILRYFGIS